MVIIFLIAFFAATIGIALPGLINMTAAKIAMQDGKDRALLFVLGALIIIFFQTLLSIIFCKYISSNKSVLQLIRQIGFALFIGLTIYFFFIAKNKTTNPKEIKIKSKTSRFFLGILLSALNFFPIPFYVYVVLSLSTAGLFDFKKISIIVFLLGVLLGSFNMFYCYIKFFKKIESKTDFFFKNMNKIIGTITGIVALIALVKILNDCMV
jgi:threonine/homoserine/homoserine lactone efflux protein